MKSIFKNIAAVVVGVVVGCAVNMGIIVIGAFIIKPPLGVDVTSTEHLKASIHLFEPQHFIFPFLAHAFGTFVAGLVAARIAVTHQLRFAVVVGCIFLLAGIVNVMMLPAPWWFYIIDLVFAYVPMAYAGGRVALRRRA